MSGTPRQRQFMQLRLLLGVLATVTIAFFLESRAPGGDGAWFGAFSFTLLVVPFLGLWLIYSLFILWRHPDRRRSQSISIGRAIVLSGIMIGGLSDVVGCVVIAIWAPRRAITEQIIASVETYKTQHGHYPRTLAEADIMTGDDSDKWGLFYNEYSAKRHDLDYLGPLPFSHYYYTFESRRWKFWED